MKKGKHKKSKKTSLFQEKKTLNINDLNKHTSRIYIIALIMSILYLLLSYFIIDDYGITVDEPACFDIGHKYWHFYKTGYLDLYGSTPVEEDHPDFSVNWEEGVVWPLINTLSAITCEIFYQRLRLLSPIDAHHAIIPIITAVFIYIFFVFVTKHWNVFVGFLSVLILITYPYFFGFAFNNTKDIPKITIFAITIFSFVEWLYSKKVRYLYLFIILLSLFMAIRMEATLILPILFLWLTPDLYKKIKNGFKINLKTLIHIITASVIALVVFILCWPPLLPWAYDSIGDFFEDAPRFAFGIIKFMRETGFQKLPQYTWNIYAFEQIFCLTSISMLILFLFGMLRIISKFKETKLHSLLLIWMFFITGRHCFPYVAHYCGMRHFVEYMVPFVITVALGIEHLAQIIHKYFIKVNNLLLKVCIAILVIVENLHALVVYHPYQILYYNPIVGGLGGAQKRGIPWSFDYFLTSYREAGEWLNKNAVKEAHYFAVYDSVLFRHYITRKDLKGIFRRPGQFVPPPDTYYILTPFTSESILDSELYDTLVYKIERGGGMILAICFFSKEFQEARQYFFQAQEDIKNNKYEEALPKLGECIKIYPKYSEAYYLLGILYFKKGLMDNSIEMLKKTLELKPHHKRAQEDLQYLLSLKK